MRAGTASEGASFKQVSFTGSRGSQCILNIMLERELRFNISYRLICRGVSHQAIYLRGRSRETKDIDSNCKQSLLQREAA